MTDNNTVTTYEYHDSSGRVWYAFNGSSSAVINWTFTYGTSAFGIDWTYKDCLVCNKSHSPYFIIGEKDDHPYITDNLDYIEYEAKRRNLV